MIAAPANFIAAFKASLARGGWAVITANDFFLNPPGTMPSDLSASPVNRTITVYSEALSLAVTLVMQLTPNAASGVPGMLSYSNGSVIAQDDDLFATLFAMANAFHAANAAAATTLMGGV